MTTNHTYYQILLSPLKKTKQDNGIACESSQRGVQGLHMVGALTLRR